LYGLRARFLANAPVAAAMQSALSATGVCRAQECRGSVVLRSLILALTKKRRLVLSHYTTEPGCTLEGALVKTGYSEKRAKITACELRRDPEFVAAIERKQAAALAKLEREALTDEEVINGIRDIDAECQLAGPVANFLALRLKAHELLCKIRGMFIERVELGFGAELAREIAAARERAEMPDLPPLIEGATDDKDLSEN
jgi:hypothetical protein